MVTQIAIKRVENRWLPANDAAKQAITQAQEEHVSCQVMKSLEDSGNEIVVIPAGAGHIGVSPKIIRLHSRS